MVQFWLLAAFIVGGAVAVVGMRNPIFCTLSLVIVMVGLAGMFVTLGAHFLAAVQLIVYAGAVMVLFLMVLMVVNLRRESLAQARDFRSRAPLLKMGMVSLLVGLLMGGLWLHNREEPLPSISRGDGRGDGIEALGGGGAGVKELGRLVFSKYVLAFETLGALLLVVAVGAVSLARSQPRDGGSGGDDGVNARDPYQGRS